MIQPSPFCLLTVLLLPLLGGAASRGQEITRVADVIVLNASEAGASPRTVRLKGVVLSVEMARNHFTLHDGTKAVGVDIQPPQPSLSLKAGDMVEILGQTKTAAFGSAVHPRVQASSVRLTGTAPLPEARLLNIPTLNAFTHFDQWVAVEGVVNRWKFSPATGELQLGLSGPGVWTMLTVLTDTRPAFADQLMGARVRVTGVNAGVTTHDANGALIAPAVAQLQVLKGGWKSTFDAPLATLAEVKGGRVEAGARVRVRAVFVRQRGFQVYLVGEDGREAQVNTLQPPWPRPAAPGEELADAGPWPVLRQGDVVELVATVSGTASTAHPLNYGDIRVVGQRALPPPLPVEIETLKAYQNTSDWVSVEGVVDSWMLNGTTFSIIIHGPRETLFLRVPDHPAGAFPKDLYGARARFTGITRRMPQGTDMYVPSPAFFEILKPGTHDRFAMPEHAAAQIVAGSAPAGELVRTRGVLLGSNDKVLHVRAADTALCVRLQTPWTRQNGAGIFYADGAPHPALQAGDELEIVGTHVLPTANPSYAPFDLDEVTVRVTGHQQQPVEPVATTLARVAAGAHTADLVQVRGRLLALQQTPAGKEWRTTLLLEADGERMPAVYEGRQLAGFERLRPDYDLLVRGFVQRATPESPRQLWLEDASQIQILGLSQVVFTRRLWLWAGGGALLVLLLLGWIIMLRRSGRIIARNAAELKTASEAARESEQRWKLLFEQSPISVQMFRPDGQTKRFNQAWKNLFHLNDEQGFAFNVLKDPDLNASGAVNLIRRAFEGEVVHVPPVPFPVNTDPPETRWIGGVLYPVKNEAGQIIEVVTIHNDITEMKRAEEAMLALNHTLEKRVEERTAELQKAQADLQRALEQERDLGELKTRFVTMVSHEFRTPLGIIMSSVELLQHYSDRLPEDEKARQLHEIQSSTKHMGGLMEQVLLLGRAEAGKLKCKPRPLDLAAFAERIIDETHSISNRRCPIALHVEGDLEGARVDETLLRHILGNLVGNAVKYSPEGAEVTLRLRREGPNAAIVVADRGIGIPEKDRERLFEAFHRCSNVGDTPGTGLGLVIMKRCVDLHGGSIVIDSEPGRGTTFTVRLPVFMATAVPEP